MKIGVFILAVLFACCKNETRTGGGFVSLTPTVAALSDTTVRVKKGAPDTVGIGPANMILVPGGYALIGSDSSGMEVESPRFWVYVQSFWMDVSPVTVGQFREFVRATGYRTQAEIFGNGGFIDSTSQNAWILKPGCDWRFPNGRDYPAAAADLPVAQVSWNDAQAYATWAGKRLPHELEFEYAARNGRNDQRPYSVGDDLKTPDGRWKANIWQGKFPLRNDLADGFRFASPVGFFGKTPLGLTDMTGNVWEWCANGKFRYSDVVGALINGTKVVETQTERAQRGGSFLCEASWCSGYRVSARSFSSPETSLLHVGFRCVL